MKIADNTVLMELGRLIETISDLDSTAEIYDCIVNFVPQVLPADHVTITHYSEVDCGINILAIYNAPDITIDLVRGQTIKSFSTYEAYSHSVCKPVIYHPAESLDHSINVSLHDAGVISALVVPLISGLEIVGTINIASREHQFQEKDKYRLEKISALLATSITHTVAFQSNGQIKRQKLYAKHLEHLNILGEQLLGADSVESALLLVARCAKELVNASRVSICELDTESDGVKVIGVVGSGYERSGTLISLEDCGLEDCLIHHQHKYSTDLLNSANKVNRSLGELGFNHVWSFPIVCAGQPHRCINITSVSTDLNIEDTMSVLNTLVRLAGSTLERIRAQLETVRQAKTDALTGLYNRKEFNEQLVSAVDAAPNEQDVCILFLDLDFFKNINDTLGHGVGDQILLEVSTRIGNLLTQQDTIARIGGDEFMILLTGMSRRASVELLAEQLIESVGKPYYVASHEAGIGVSIGICRFPEHGATAEELIKNADIAMYKAKEAGKNQYCSFTQELSNEIGYRSLLQKELVKALKGDQFSLVYQPQVDIKTMRVDCVEVLLRWNHRKLGAIPPDVFIPLAENCGIISLLTDWVLEKAFSDMIVWQKQFPDVKLALNVSALEFSPHFDLLARLIDAIESSGVRAGDLEVELTETAFLHHPEHASTLAQQLHDAGISIALDDFGTGFASLTYLVQLPISRIKIDRSFIDGVEDDIKKQAVINGILAIANGLNIQCIGEGVETDEQLSWLESAGCNGVQGYLLSKPVGIETLEAVLEEFMARSAKSRSFRAA